MTRRHDLFRAIASRNFSLIEASGMRAVPPRLPEQPIVHPVTNENPVGCIERSEMHHERSASQANRRRPSPLRGDGAFRGLNAPYALAEGLDALNAASVGPIEVIAEHAGEGA